MYFRKQRGDLRTWLLLVLALVPTWSVLIGAGWLWNERGEEIAEFESALVPIDTTYELFAASSKMLRSEASLRMAALPGASDEVIARAQRDLDAALLAIRTSGEVLVPLIANLDPSRENFADPEVLGLLGSSLSLAVDVFEAQVPGEPVTLELQFTIKLARDTAAGLVLPLVNGGDPEASYFYDTLGATVQYHDQFDRDRADLLTALSQSTGSFDLAELIDSDLRAAEWRDLNSSRTFVPVVAEVQWFGTSNDPDNPLLLDPAEPLSSLISSFGEMTTVEERNRLFLMVQEIDDALEADVDMAHSELTRETHEYIDGLVQDRRLTSIASTLMAFLGLALAWLTISEVRRRRRVETAHAEALHQLGEKADRDPTTGVWNRRRLESSVLQMIAEAPAARETVVLAYLDLDHFKSINDVWGHSTGDEVLQTVTGRLHDFSYHGIDFELCRFGGDEFVLFAQMPTKSLVWLEGLGAQIIESVDSEMEIDGRRHEVGVSVGIATSNEDSTLDSLLLEADSSLILAKQERGSAVVYNRDISRTGELVHALPDALAAGEICAHIQPVVNASTGHVVHVEALARWSRPNGEQVSPAVFIPLVESYGLADRLTATVLRSVQEFIAEPTTPRNVRVWINVSPRELDVAHFAERFVTSLRELGVAPTRIGIEITETAAVRDPKRLGIELRRLRDVGIGVAIDDFGNGYSPLGYLRLLPVDTVKLDRSLISNIDTDIANQHIVVGIVGLAHQLGMDIVAEGVERIEEQEWLVAHDVERIQGFLYGRPECPTRFSWADRDLATPTTAASSLVALPS